MVVAVIARFMPMPGKAAAVEAVLRRMVGHTRREPGCRCYDLYGAAGGFLLHEIYQDQAALEAHRAADYFADYRRDIGPLLDAPIEVTPLESLDVEPTAPILEIAGG
jgi:quinol monooxygenase YgiN